MINTIREDCFKERYIYPHLEDIIPFKRYAFTINPKPTLMKSFTETYIHYTECIGQLLNLDFIRYELRPEISTNSTLLHFHGTIEFTRAFHIPSFYFHTIPRLKDFCTFAIENIFSWEWSYYIRKQRHMMKPYVQNSCHLPYHISSKINPDLTRILG